MQPVASSRASGENLTQQTTLEESTDRSGPVQQTSPARRTSPVMNKSVTQINVKRALDFWVLHHEPFWRGLLLLLNWEAGGSQSSAGLLLLRRVTLDRRHDSCSGFAGRSRRRRGCVRRDRLVLKMRRGSRGSGTTLHGMWRQRESWRPA